MAITITTIETLDDLKAHVKATTAKYRDPAPVGEPALSPFATKLLDIYQRGDFGCRSEPVGEILAAMVQQCTGEVVEFKKGAGADGFIYESFSSDANKRIKFTAVVSMGPERSHNYVVGEATILTSNGTHSHLRSDGEQGNNLHGTWRWATDAEIDATFAKLGRKRNKAALLGIFE